MKLFRIPDEVREEEYEEDGETNDGDGGKCGGCNWVAGMVWLLEETEQDAIGAFRENHRGLCSFCMCEMISSSGYEVTEK